MMPRHEEKHVQLSCKIDPQQLDDLRAMSDRTKVPMAMLVRRGIDMALAEMEQRLEAEEIGQRVLEKRARRGR